MKQTTGDLWRLPADARCITTNGAVRKDGCAIMGRGVAAQAKERWPAVPKWLGDSITSLGNHVVDFFLPHNDPDMAPLVAFPVKHHWQQAADLDLILRSCRELMDLADERPWQRILLVRPGCGNGRLDWAQVGPAIAPLLDDRVTIVYADVVQP